jgi:uncharacterized protein
VYVANTFILKATSTCNLRCGYCYMFEQADRSAEYQPPVMDSAVLRSAACAIAAYCAKFHQPKALIVFHGGEPTLAGPAWFRQAVQVFGAHMPAACSTSFAMQTNGVLLNDDWVNLCAELEIGVSISLDGPPAVHDRQRTKATGAGSYRDAVAAIQRIQRHAGMQRLFGGVLCVVNPSEDGRAIYRHFRSLGIETMDFLLPVEANWDHPPSGCASPTPFADYLIPIFDEWWSENNPKVRITYFDSLLHLLVGSRVHSDALGGDPLTMVVVDCDGSIEPVDSLRACGNGFTKLGLNTKADPIERAFQHPTFQLALAGQEGLCATCRRCELRDICGGGYLPSRFRQANGFDNTSVYCADLTKLIHHVVDACALHLTSVTSQPCV